MVTVRVATISEFAPPGLEKVLAVSKRLPSNRQLTNAIENFMLRAYEKETARFRGDLGVKGKFELKARWKQNEIRKQARTMADSLAKTLKEQAGSIRAKGLSAQETRRHLSAMIRYKG